MEELKPRKSFIGIMKVLEAIMPWAVILSILGLILEYTALKHLPASADQLILGKSYVALFNIIFDIFFAIDVIIRTLAYSYSFKALKHYMGRGLGWVDWLAAIPGFLLPLELFAGQSATTEQLRQFKIARLGKFLRIIRLLRILRLFKFLDKMNKDSIFIQKHIVSLVIAITLLSITAIAITDTMFSVDDSKSLALTKSIYSDKVKELSNKEIHYFANTNTELLTLSELNEIDQIEKDSLISVINKLYPETKNLDSTQLKEYIETKRIPLNNLRKELLANHDSIILILLLLLTITLIMIIFYFGPKLAKDIRRVQLIVDSVEANDYFLIQSEMEVVREESGSDQYEPGEDELHALIKVMNQYPEKVNELQEREEEIKEQEDFLHKHENDIMDHIENAVKESMDKANAEQLGAEDLMKIAEQAAVETIKKSAASFFEATKKVIREEFVNWRKS